MRDLDSPADGLSPEAAVAKVAGPNRAWLSAALIVACGLGAAGLATLRPFTWEALRPWACAGYGFAIGGLLSVLPCVVSLVTLGSALNRRPATEDPAWPWWPLRLLASALRDTPSLRRTADDFRTAVHGFVSQARGLLGQRLWPACVAAFTAPVLGLVSAWVSWKVHLPEAVRLAQEKGPQSDQAEVVPVVDWSLVAWPMIITIALSLALMLAVVLADQLAGRLLQRWAETVRPLDAESQFVQERLAVLADGQLAALGERLTSDRAVEPRPRPVDPPPPPPERPQPQVSAQQLEGLGELFRNG
jgi:hypothetical protein